jgi:8-oxo-dGTP diphosphatase
MAKKGKYVYEWPRPMVAADAAVFRRSADKMELLLVNRKRNPFKGKWCIPGGFVNLDEELGDAAARELAEETGLTGVKLKQLHAFGKVGRDPRGRVITVTFTGIAGRGQKKIKAGDDAAKARWFDIGNLPKDLAFDHNEVVKLAIGKLKKRKTYRLKANKPKTKKIKRRQEPA